MPNRRRPLTLALLLAAAPLTALPIPVATLAAQNRDPERARFITEDIPRFWEAFDQRGTLGAAHALDSLYFARGSRGLADFGRLRLSDRAGFARTVDLAAPYYASTRESMARIASMEPALRTVLRRLHAEVPDAVFPDVYFVVGRLSTGGTTSASGLLIGAEMYGRTADSLLGPPLNAWHRAVLRPVEDVTAIVAHELVHYQQRGAGATLLERALREGIADFVGERVSGKNINAGAQAWAESRERALWQEFRAVMLGTDVSGWLYNGSNAGDRPADLGYVMGYRIARAWFARQGGTPDAMRRMLDLRGREEAERFVAESGYEP